MSLETAATGARVIETLKNYAIADSLAVGNVASDTDAFLGANDDGEFWQRVLSDPVKSWNAEVYIPQALLSGWVARVPGLFWTLYSKTFRNFSSRDVEKKGPGGVTLLPMAKSRVVMGGVGTLRIPPDNNGRRLATLTTTANVSAGIPVLLSEEYWRHHKLEEGSIISNVVGYWRAMSLEWSNYFPSIKGIPRGYLVLDEKNGIKKYGRSGVQIHPYSIMEYETQAHEAFAFVYATANSTDPAYRHGVEDFFEGYRQDNGRNGRYLIGADLIQPIWEAIYDSPEQLRRSHPAGSSHLALLEARVRRSMVGDDIFDDVLERLTSLGDVEHLKRISLELSIPYTLWFTSGTLAQSSAQFLAKVPEEKLPVLVDMLVHHGALDVRSTDGLE